MRPTTIGSWLRLGRENANPRIPQRLVRKFTVAMASAGDAQRSLASHATYLLAATLLAEPLQVVIVGDAATPGFAELRRVAAGSAAPGRLILTLAPDAELPPTHPAAGKRLLDGRATAYVCTGAACEAPLTDAVALRSRLAA